MCNYRNIILLPIVLGLCKTVISASRYEWIGALPLLHIIKHDRFIPQQPYSLPFIENEIEACLFCGLELDLKDVYNKGLDKRYYISFFIHYYFIYKVWKHVIL